MCKILNISKGLKLRQTNTRVIASRVSDEYHITSSVGDILKGPFICLNDNFLYTFFIIIIIIIIYLFRFFYEKDTPFE